VGTAEIWGESDITRVPHHFFDVLDPDPSVNALSPKICYQRIGLLVFGVPLVLDPSVYPSLDLYRDVRKDVPINNLI
jgi:hypothetical protein